MSDLEERKIGEFTLRILRTSCISSGSCTRVTPELLEFDDQQIVTFRDDAPGTLDRERVIEACEVCPVEALVVLDADGTQLVP